MTPEQVQLVQQSFAKVAPISEQAATIFYDRLFEVAPAVRAMFPDDMKEQRKKLMATLAARTMVGRNGQAADFAGVTVFLASRASDYVTGQTLYVDGGFSAT